MTKTTIRFENLNLPLYQVHTLIIGSGAASLNCAWHLSKFGQRDILIVTERLGGGTSNNSGSDKQTFYKLSLFGEGKDSVYEMAEALFNGGAMHGDIALVEAALSAQEFYHLVQIGVPFPHNTYGGYVGYKTDHDPKQRATSAGPWTSNQMFQKLRSEVEKEEIPILDGHEVIALFTKEEAGESRVVGALAIDKSKAEKGLGSLVLFQAENIVIGTGGPGGLYETSVYPRGHLGSTGIALEIGATAVNLTEWQYGLASTKFRWNVSGTYQQVIPRYISTKPDGSDEQEFLNDYFPTLGKLGTAIFLKGYQWPFDPRKIQNYGSSLIDLLVYQETVIKGRKVFMDFRRNPSTGKGNGEFPFKELEEEAYGYLEKSGALFGTPLERLERMNPMASELYKENGIDLRSEPLEIAVCAQHNNGGLKGNIWWESNVRHLFPIGEVNGTHGIYRPGGSALNSGQVGGYRAAQYIANCYQDYSLCSEEFLTLIEEQLRKKLSLVNTALSRVDKEGQDMQDFRKTSQRLMSKVAAHIRKGEWIKEALQESEAALSKLNSGKVRLNSQAELLEFFQNRQLLLTQIAVLKSIDLYLERGGGSRGSYLVLDDSGESVKSLDAGWKFRLELKELRREILEYTNKNGEHFMQWVPVRPIPEDDFWFENVWQDYINKKIFA
jgi:succinate dehydrogenase/fumarate reductase flavoprotein subunit